MDRGSITTTQVFNRGADQDDTKLQVQRDLESFVMSFRIDNRYVYRWVGLQSSNRWCLQSILTLPARDQLKENALLKKYFCDININDLISYNEELAHRLVTEPAEVIPLVSDGVLTCRS